MWAHDVFVSRIARRFFADPANEPAGRTARPIDLPRFATLAPTRDVNARDFGPVRTPPIEFEGVGRWRFWWLAGALVAVALLVELRTSFLQARFLSGYAHRISYAIEPGASPEIVFPGEGPSNERRGYIQIPRFRQRLEATGYHVVEQARFSKEMLWLATHGVTPPFRMPSRSGITIRDASGVALYAPFANAPIFRDPGEIPDLVTRTLLFIENRELGDPADNTSNPAVEWDRTARASLLYLGRRVGLPLTVEGGSTLATQIEKYRYSAGGRTSSGMDKLRQIAAASLRAYREGPDTRGERQAILLEYLNTMPLSAAPGWGEVQGLGEGLRAWFGMDLAGVSAALAAPEDGPGRARAYKHALALICAVRAPSGYLIRDREALEARTHLYTRLLAGAGILDEGFAGRVEQQRLEFTDSAGPRARDVDWTRRKAINRVRNDLAQRLGVPGLHDLDRLDLEIATPIDGRIEEAVAGLFEKLRDPRTVAALGLTGERMLSKGDPSVVVYSFLLFEPSEAGNLLRAQVDSLEQPFDLNDGMKLELGSTAKLRTLAHYLEIVAEIHRELTRVPPAELPKIGVAGRDTLTRWAARALVAQPDISRTDLLQRSLERTYPADPAEVFYTGGAPHTFANFDKEDDVKVVSIREALRRSVNLPFVRLLRDVVAFHMARLPYDARSVVRDARHPDRHRLLVEIADEEATTLLRRAYREAQKDPPAPAGTNRLDRWVAEQLGNEPRLTWHALLESSADVRRDATEWLTGETHRNAQDYRLLARIERDAFERMTPAWRRLGFPFERLVPSLATALGTSGDRPAALAELMGILVNDGVRRPVVRMGRLQFAEQTPYHTVLEPGPPASERVLDAPVARVLRDALRDVVENGTARRVAGAFLGPDGKAIPCGGKTGSGDNRFETVAPDGSVLSSRAVNRTATFVFYVGNRYFGVLTAFVPGAQAAGFRFTSALPVTVLKHLAPALNERLAAPPRAVASLRNPGPGAVSASVRAASGASPR